jgi:hypothetical protein
MLHTILCKKTDFQSDWYNHWRLQIAQAAPELDSADRPVWDVIWRGMADSKTMHRKLWEWCAISQALAERFMLNEGKKGIGFAVGSEPLASLFAAHGANVLASDYVDGSSSTKWAETHQLADSLEKIHWPGFLPFETFRERVRYQNINMKDLSLVPANSFDFSWSSCSFEHLGSLEAGLDFLIHSLTCLKRGGVAVHTTEFNISSNTDTIEFGQDVIYRRKDIESFDYRLRQIGCALEPMDFNPGCDEEDVAFDEPPYYTKGRQHIKLKLGGYITTSLLLVIRKWI